MQYSLVLRVTHTESYREQLVFSTATKNLRTGLDLVVKQAVVHLPHSMVAGPGNEASSGPCTVSLKTFGGERHSKTQSQVWFVITFGRGLGDCCRETTGVCTLAFKWLKTCHGRWFGYMPVPTTVSPCQCLGLQIKCLTDKLPGTT